MLSVRIHRPFISFLSLSIALFLSACTSSSQRDEVKGLTHKDANHRATLVQDVNYQLTFFFEKESETFRGESKMTFEMLQANQDITIDFNDGTVDSLQIDGEDITGFTYNGMFITVPGKNLAKGRREITVQFEHPFSKTGSGLYRFKDPEDGRVYLYSDFEPYDANLLFPCFDQPNLKATYETTVMAPANWSVFSSTREDVMEKGADGQRKWHFPQSKKFSTYIYALVAGPYKVWNSKAGKLPLRLAARQSYAKHVNAQKWFTITKQGFEFYDAYFDYPYPFEKYDQLIVPDFNAGAMENVAAVTFNETYFPKGQETESQAERRASVILHEMAHMWFGNLVTMKWWDDLWLNESFATFMASLALQENTRFKRSWETFFTRMKDWAYWEDQLVTTHPIVGTVKDTESAFVSFDGITYGKGASALKQLNFFLGPEQFRDGVRKYFKKYAYKNTIMTDFVFSLAEAADTDLNEWTEKWLRTASLNTVEAKYTCDSDKIKTFTLLQTAPDEYATLRPHKTQIGLFGRDGKLTHTEPLAYSEKSTDVASLVGKACPAFVYPNFGDHDFVKVKLDAKSLEWSKKSLNRFKSAFLRTMVWKDIWAMVRDADLDYYSWLELVYLQLPKETDIKVAETVAGLVRNPNRYLPTLTLGGREVTLSSEWQTKFENLYWLLFKEAKAGTDFQKLWFDRVVSSAQGTESLNRIDSILQGSSDVSFRLNPGEDRRWRAVVALNKGLHPEATKRLETELKSDGSEKGKKFALVAEVIRPENPVKEKWFAKITQPKTDLSVARLRAIMRNLFPRGQERISALYVDRFFASLDLLADKKDNVFLRSFSRWLSPQLCANPSSDALESYLSSSKGKSITPVVRKTLRVSLQEDQRCQKIIELALKTADSRQKN